MFWTFVAAAQVANGLVTVEGEKAHHLARVLRLRPGERGIAVSNQRAYQLEIVDVSGEHVVGRILGEEPISTEPTTSVSLLQAALPHADFDAVIEAGTQVGISRFVAVQAERSVGRPAAGRVARWRAIAESAAEQSHRGVVPTVEGPMTLDTAMDAIDGSRTLVLDPSAAHPLGGAIDGSRSYAIAVGPEGGWTDGERALFASHGALGVNLGPRILRARLAPIVAAAILVQQS